MVNNTADLRAIVDAVLDPRAFSPPPRKRDTSWYRSCAETLLVVNLQKSDLGGQYYVNLGVALPALTPGEFPREELCQLRMRLDRIVDDRESLVAALDLENRASDIGREAVIAAGVQRGAEWLERLSTARALKDAIVSSAFIASHGTGQLKEYLGLPVNRIARDGPVRIVIGPAPKG